MHCCSQHCCSKPGFLEYWLDFFLFYILAPTVPFILGQLGNPIFGNKAIAIWLWHGPNNRFSDLYLRQKIIFLLADGTLVARGQALWSGRGPGRTPLYSLSAALSFSPLDLENIFLWFLARSQIFFFFFYQLYFELRSAPVPHFLTLSFLPGASGDPLLFNLFLQRKP